MPKTPKNRLLKVPQQESKSKIRKIPLYGGISVIATFLAYLALIPRVTTAISDPPDSNDPLSSSVTITNNSIYPVNSVNTRIKIAAICVVDGPDCQPKTYFPAPDRYRKQYKDLSTVQRLQWGNRDLGIDQGFTIAFNDLFAPPPGIDQVTFVDLAIVISFEIPIVHRGCPTHS